MTVGVAVLGSTGSIGTSTVRVLERQQDNFRVVALTAYGSEELLKSQAKAVGARFVGLAGGSANQSRPPPAKPVWGGSA